MLAATTTAACGGTAFEDALPDGGGEDGANGPDGSLDANVTIGPPTLPDGAPSPKDAGRDSTTNELPDATADSGQEADSAQAKDSAEPDSSRVPDSGLPDAGLADSAAPFDAAVADACATTQPDTVHGVFVSTSSMATTGCGGVSAPCGTIAAGISAAQTQGKSIVYLDKGTYAEQVSLVTGITVTGGWIYAGTGAWTKECTGDASALAIIQPATANASVIATGVTATLDTLTVKSKATANASESLYGIFVSGSASLAMNGVEVSVAAAGNGVGGGIGGTPAPPVCSPAQNGATGGAASLGVPVAGTYSSTGYTPGAGGAGGAGKSGSNGTAAPGPGQTGGPTTVTSYQVCDSSNTMVCIAGTDPIVGNTGTFGCGGPGGAPGLGGGGGGSSIGLFVWQSTAEVGGGSLASFTGGNGGPGSAGATAATSWTQMNGAPGGETDVPACTNHVVGGQPQCSQSTIPRAIGGIAGGPGGSGSQGGTGAGGAGGDSYSYYVGGGGTVTLSGSPSLTYGAAGTSSGAIPGGDGHSGPHYP